jgi:hypothetical protein
LAPVYHQPGLRLRGRKRQAKSTDSLRSATHPRLKSWATGRGLRKTNDGAMPSLCENLALGELEALASAFLSVLLALFGAGVTGKEALDFEALAQFHVEFQQGAGNTHL